MSKIDEHKAALGDVIAIRDFTEETQFVLRDACSSLGEHLIQIQFEVHALTGRRRDVSDRSAGLVADAICELWGEIADKAVQLAEAREFALRLEARVEAIAYLENSGVTGAEGIIAAFKASDDGKL